jgi:hypothetical protein
MMKNDELTPNQKRTIAALLSSKTLGEACKLAGISRSTLARWMDDSQFRDALSKAQGEAIHETAISFFGGRELAQNVLRNLMSNGASESVRRQTAMDWLNMLIRFNDLTDIEARLTRLEAEQKERQKTKAAETTEANENPDDLY